MRYFRILRQHVYHRRHFCRPSRIILDDVNLGRAQPSCFVEADLGSPLHVGRCVISCPITTPCRVHVVRNSLESDPFRIRRHQAHRQEPQRSSDKRPADRVAQLRHRLGRGSSAQDEEDGHAGAPRPDAREVRRGRSRHHGLGLQATQAAGATTRQTSARPQALRALRSTIARRARPHPRARANARRPRTTFPSSCSPSRISVSSARSRTSNLAGLRRGTLTRRARRRR